MPIAARQFAQPPQANVEIVFPVQANAVFARMDDQLIGLMRAGGVFTNLSSPDVYRLMFLGDHASDIGDFIRDVT